MKIEVNIKFQPNCQKKQKQKATKSYNNKEFFYLEKQLLSFHFAVIKRNL